MKKRVMRCVPALALVMALMLTGCGGENIATEETAVGTAVQTQTVELDTISTENTVSGKVVSDSESTILVGASVKCTAVYFEAGDEVEAGDVICTLDLSSMQSNYNAASIGYQSAAQSYQNQSAVFADQIALYRKNVEDLKALKEIGAASQVEIDQAELQLQSAIATRDATLAQLKATMESTKSSVEQLGTVLEDVDSNGNVIAPMSGTLVTMNAVEGSFLSAALPVAVINDTSAMKVTVSVAETLAPKLSIGDSVDVYVSSVNGSFAGTIRSVEKAANAQTKLYSVTISVPEAVDGLLSGMFADVTFRTDMSHNTVVIPTEAILTDGNTQFVYVVENDAAKYMEITTGITGNGVTEVTSGLTAGQELVTVGQSYLSDGAVVRVVGSTDASTVKSVSLEG